MNRTIIAILVVFVLACTSCNENSPSDLYRRWQFVGIDGPNGIRESPLPQDTIYLSILGPGYFDGRAYGLCTNNYFGDFQFRTFDSLVVLAVGSTEMDCINGRYWDYIERLRQVKRHQLSPEFLRLYSNNGNCWLVFRDQ